MSGRRARVATLLAVVLAACSGGGGPMQTAPSSPPWVERVLESREPPTSGKPPLVVMLHGIGADENDLFPLAGEIDKRFKVVSLRAPYDYHTGHAWFRIDFGPGGAMKPDVAQARATLGDLVRWIAAAPERLRVDPARVFLLGFSQGAMMSIGVLRTAPERLAGVVALSGRGDEELFEVAAPRDAIARVPLLVAHGTDDDVLPIENGRRTRDLFQGLSRDFTYREFPVRHGIDHEEMVVVEGWLAARVGAPSGR